MHKKTLVLATICAIAFSVCAIASPVDFERTQLIMAVSAQVDTEAAAIVPALDISIEAIKADVELSMPYKDTELHYTQRSIESAFEPMVASVTFQPIIQEVGWRYSRYSF